MKDYLASTPIRAFRDGKWDSYFIDELDFVTDEELAALSWVKDLTALFQGSSKWKRDDAAKRWIKVKAP